MNQSGTGYAQTALTIGTGEKPFQNTARGAESIESQEGKRCSVAGDRHL